MSDLTEILRIAIGRAKAGRPPRHMMICGSFDLGVITEFSTSEGASVLPEDVTVEGLRERIRSANAGEAIVCARDFSGATEEALGEMIQIAHEASQKNRPFILIGAGGEDMRKRAGDARCYAEMMFAFFDPQDEGPRP